MLQEGYHTGSNDSFIIPLLLRSPVAISLLRAVQDFKRKTKDGEPEHADSAVLALSHAVSECLHVVFTNDGGSISDEERREIAVALGVLDRDAASMMDVLSGKNNSDSDIQKLLNALVRHRLHEFALLLGAALDLEGSPHNEIDTADFGWDKPDFLAMCHRIQEERHRLQEQGSQ